MKLVQQNNGLGSVKLVPEVDDDLWDAYNLIDAGDLLEAVTVRKFFHEAPSGSREAGRVRLSMEIVVESKDYDKDGSLLRVRGRSNTKSEYVKVGQYHTLELELKRPFVLRKDAWDWAARQTLRQACDAAAGADLAVVLMEEGRAQLFLVGRSLMSARARVEAPIPRKHGTVNRTAYETALREFFERLLQALLQNVDFNVVQCLVIASPAFYKDQFRDYMLLEATRRDIRKILHNKERILLAKSNSGYEHSLKEVLENPGVMALIKDTKAAQEVPAMKDFYDTMMNDSARACYGPKHVDVAHDQLAIQTLLLTDTLFRSSDVAVRRKYADLVDSVKKNGGRVHIFSSMHVSGDQLAQLTGVAAILRFPMPELDDIEM